MLEFEMDKQVYNKIDKPNTKSLMQGIKSAIALDVAPKHTGVVIWNGNDFEEYGFALSEPIKSDSHWLYKLRKEFKDKLIEIINCRYFEYCIIEDIYGGENYDTLIQLAEINDVIDELIDQNVCIVDNFYRKKPTEWMSKYRVIYKQSGKLKSKIETQGLLEYLDCDFYLKYKDYPETQNKQGLKTKKELFFEDICDAYGMLIAIAAMVKLESVTEKEKKKKISLKKDIKMVYVEKLEDCNKNRDKRIKGKKVQVELGKNLKNSILSLVEENPKEVMYAYVPVMKLGTFGVDNKFTFYKSGEGYIVFYLKNRDEIG